VKIVIVGGGAGGASVAASARRLDEHAQIILIDKRAEVSPATCGLPDPINEPIQDRRRLAVLSPEDFARGLNVEVRACSEVVQIARREKSVTIHDLRDGRHYTESYDRLVLASGSTPIVPPITGIHRPHVFTLQSIEDLDYIKHHIRLHPCRHAVVVGAGLIGLQVADNLQQIGIHVSIVEKARQALGALDYEMATLVHQQLHAKGIRLLLEKEVREFTKDRAILVDGEQLPADLIVLALGVRPTTLLASRAGIKLGALGGIAVDENLATSDAHIYALGDAIEVDDGIIGEKTLLPLAEPAHKQAAVIAENLFGGQRAFRAAPGTVTAQLCDLAIAKTGLSEKRLQTSHIDYGKSYVDLHCHASDYSGASPLTLKLLFAKAGGRILGAQIVGSQDAEKHIDVIATAIRFGETIYALAELNPAYAPPYSSAMGPVSTEDMLRENFAVIYWDELATVPESFILDVRTPEEYALYAIPGSKNIPLDELHNRLAEIPTDKTVVLYCQQGKKGYIAYRILAQRGFKNLRNLCGGLKLLQTATRRHGDASRSEAVEETALPGTRPTTGPGHAPSGDRIVFENTISLEIDATGLCCPGPIVRLSHGIKSINDGQYLLITASDPEFEKDIETWCRKTGHALHSRERSRSVTKAVIRKDPGTGSKNK
jgi:NADPH-dependent 2,4-dienoyl-CoA reductase/sulfur reductase-like enzyme/rhodanese-related sulfurtransferase/TusA-related sulfurtransferase